MAAKKAKAAPTGGPRNEELRKAVLDLCRLQGNGDWMLDWDEGVAIRVEKDGSIVAVGNDEETDKEVILGRVQVVVVP